MVTSVTEAQVTFSRGWLSGGKRDPARERAMLLQALLPRGALNAVLDQLQSPPAVFGNQQTSQLAPDDGKVFVVPAQKPTSKFDFLLNSKMAAFDEELQLRLLKAIDEKYPEVLEEVSPEFIRQLYSRMTNLTVNAVLTVCAKSYESRSANDIIPNNFTDKKL